MAAGRRKRSDERRCLVVLGASRHLRGGLRLAAVAGEEGEAMKDYRSLVREQLTGDPILHIDVRPVYQKDLFRFAYGADRPFLQHAPYIGKDGRGELEGGYAIAWLKGGAVRIEHVVAETQDVESTLWLAVQQLSRWFVPPSIPEMSESAQSKQVSPLPTRREPQISLEETTNAGDSGQPDSKAYDLDLGPGVLREVLERVPRIREATVQRRRKAGRPSRAEIAAREANRANPDEV